MWGQFQEKCVKDIRDSKLWIIQVTIWSHEATSHNETKSYEGPTWP